MNISGASSSPTGQSGSPRERLRLSGHSTQIDATRFAVRADLADVELAARVFAPHYARALPYRVTFATALLAEPRPDAEVRAMLDEGAEFGVLDLSGGFAWGKADDGTPGYLPIDRLTR